MATKRELIRLVQAKIDGEVVLGESPELVAARKASDDAREVMRRKREKVKAAIVRAIERTGAVVGSDFAGMRIAFLFGSVGGQHGNIDVDLSTDPACVKAYRAMLKNDKIIGDLNARRQTKGIALLTRLKLADAKELPALKSEVEAYLKS